MFHHSYSSAPSYRTPVSQINPREKYLAALAEAKAAEAEYLAAERLQQEEDQLRQRLEQIQSLKHQPSDYYTHIPASQYSQAALLDLDALRRQIAAEERARIVREQKIEALRVQGAQHKAQKQARELDELRIREERRAQLAVRDFERSRALAAQRAELQAHTQRALAPSFRVVVTEGSRTQHRRTAQRSSYPEFHETLDLAPTFSGKRNHHHQAHGCGCEREAHKVQMNSTAVTLEDVVSQLFGGVRVEAKSEPKPEKTQAPPEAVSVEQLLQHVFGGNTAAQLKAESKPVKEAPAQHAESPITVEQLISHFLGAAGIEVEQSKGSSSNATASIPTSTQPSEKEKTAPAPATSQSAPKPALAPAPTPATAQAPQPVGCEHIINHFLGATGARPAAATQPNQAGVEVDLQQLLNMFLGGAVQTSAPTQPQAGPSNSASASKHTETGPAANKTTLQEREERELAEAIRMSLAESQPQPSSTTSESKGKAPAPAPVKDVASSTAEVHAIDASFAALSSEFVFPTQLDFSTSRTASPTRNGTAEESVMANLSYSTQNQPVRFYHQALSGLLARLDAVESFGDEGLRHGRKEVVGRVEGALDEVERVVEAKWRRWAGRERASTPEPVPAPSRAVEEAPVIVTAPTAEPVEVAEPEPVPAPDTIPEPTPVPVVEPEVTPSASYPPASELSSSYPPSATESVATLRPSSPAPSHVDPVPASPAPSDIDTFLLPASAAAPVMQKKPRASDSDADVDVGSDWSELDA
ncbi:hypothetical protein DFH08DRAFT_849924 [Mycena albidolilacea]|uniref:BAG domain-containing protein n=1 Tax=Mycena albidolilacea TaxID=1033008 RepID=A0AAD7AEN3_9AGAR|nr:hypothetical protein DFH08DRAFT_849924 [Mycena albidolilacea]